MEFPVARLDIPLEWWLWKGYLHDTPTNHTGDEQLLRYWSCPSDPVDDPNYDEWKAFPSVTPRFDVFGPGPRTRKQRGWVQVAQRHRDHSGLGYPQDHGHLATAADIPPELFDVILAHIYTLCGDKRVLSSISLVCRRWAYLMQPRIFWNITLRDRSDVNALCGFTLSRRSRVASYIREVKLSLDVTEGPSPPWVHTFCAVLVPRLHVVTQSYPWNISLDVIGPLPHSQTMKNVHNMLPKPLLSWMSQGITNLKLLALSFRTFADLLQMLQGFPTLYFVDFEALAWKRTVGYNKRPVTSYLNATPRLHDREISYSVQGCSDNAASTWLSILLAPTRADRLNEEEAGLMCRLGSALVQYIDGTRYPNWAMRSVRLARTESDYSEFWATHNRRDLTASVRVCYTPRTAEHAKRVQVICFDFTWESCLPVSDVIGFTDWSTIDAVAHALSELDIFVFHLETRDDLLLFHNEVVRKKMPHLRNSARLKYTRVLSRSAEQRHVTEWTQVECAEETVEDIGRPLRVIDFHRLL